jgi:hypothetical protein
MQCGRDKPSAHLHVAVAAGQAAQLWQLGHGLDLRLWDLRGVGGWARVMTSQTHAAARVEAT